MTNPHKFEKHLFISYAHLDNQPLTPEQQGWISRFHASLEVMLSMRLGHTAEIWRDQKLSGNDVFADEIVAQFPKTALLISVLTPRYLESTWCTREVLEFCKAVEQSGGVVMGNKSRVIKVIKTPVDNESPLPPVMKELLGYPFYVFDDEHTPLELDPVFGPDMAQKYNLKIAKLAWDIAQQLKELEASAPALTTVTEPVPSKPTIYLAECSWDQRQAREQVEVELRICGHSIVPDRQLSRDETAYIAEVTRLIEQSKLSIHLVGATYGAVPDGPTQKSVVVLQNELAAAQSRSTGLRRVIWIPEGIQSQQLEQQRFIETLHTSADAQFGADVIVGDLETLKSTIHATLEKLEKLKPPELQTDGSLVHLICDERDRKSTIPLRRFLKNQGLVVEMPLFEGDAATVRQANQDLLTQCDSVIIYYGAGDALWKHTVDSDLRKMKGYRGKKPLWGIYTYLDEPATDDKKDLIEMEEPDVINGLGGFPEQQMQALIKKLRGAGIP